MKTYIYSYRSGEQVVPTDAAQNVIQIIEELNYSLKKYEIKQFKLDLSEKLKLNGWIGQVKLSSKSSISITAICKKIGLCTQTGNMARMYADLMKLQAMYLDDTISSAIYVLPTKACANSFGGNIVNYERFVNELTNIFSKVITVPMVVVGFDNEGEEHNYD